MNILKLNSILRKNLISGLSLVIFLLLCIDGCCPVLTEVEVFFDSKPAGASLWIEGQYMGYQTPITLPLYPGKYSLTLKKDNYCDWQEEIQVEKMQGQEILAELVVARKQEITIQLNENYGQDASVLAFHPYGDYSSTIQKRLIVFAHIPLKTKLFMFKTDIANYRNKELKDEIVVRLGFWM